MSIIVHTSVFAFTAVKKSTSLPATLALKSTSQAKVIILADVNFREAKITAQEGNNFKISFSLSNGLGVQTGVMYGVELISPTPNGPLVVDEKVYPESVSLAEKSTIKREITYTAPGVLSGTYKLFLTSKNESGFTFSIGSLGEVKLSNSIKGVEILPESCIFTINGDNGTSSSFKLGQAVSLSPLDNFHVTCDAINQLDKAIEVSPSFVTTRGTIYGKEVSSGVIGINPAIIFQPNEKKTITLDIPKSSIPKLYHLDLSLKSGEISSNTINTSYLVQGTSASIDFLSMDKDYYQKGDTLNLSFVWSYQSSDNYSQVSFPSSVVVTDLNGKKCASPINQTLIKDFSNPETKIPIAITRTCFNPQVLVTMKDNSGNILDQKSFKMETTSVKQSEAVHSNSNTDYLIILLIVVIIVLIVITALVIRKNRNAKKAIAPLSNSTDKEPAHQTNSTSVNILLPFLLLVASLGFIPTHSASAQSFLISYTTSPYNCTVIGTVGLDNTTYAENATIVATGSWSGSCNGQMPPNFTGGLMATSSNAGSTAQTIVTLNGGAGGTNSINFNSGPSASIGSNTYITFNPSTTIGSTSITLYYTVMAPTVTVYGNNVNPLTVPYNSPVNITWTSYYATSCTCTYGPSNTDCTPAGATTGQNIKAKDDPYTLGKTTAFNVVCNS